MAVSKDNFFRIFQSDLREGLQRFFENRNVRISEEIVEELVDRPSLAKLIAFDFIEHDSETSEYRLDDRVERFLDEMLGAVEIAQADWLISLIDEIRRSIEGYHKLSDTAKAAVFSRKVCRSLRGCKGRILRHLEEIQSAVDYDYRAGSDYEVKLLNLQWHLERAESYGRAIEELNKLLRNDAFFQIHRDTEILSLRRGLILRCAQVGDGLTDIYQRIAEYLNRVLRDYDRARKLIRLCAMIDRHEHFTSTNLEEVSTAAAGPWFSEIQVRTTISPSVTDRYPEILARALMKVGVGERQLKARQVEIEEPVFEEDSPIIDWTNVYKTFVEQEKDLFTFLGTTSIGGKLLSEEERVDGYCSILSDEKWALTWDRPFEMNFEGGWEYALVFPRATKII
ncbi:MAG: hypothetical protein JWM68_702 [Verrucomicrobiales bacterium]|nr:hypothetical protein [Verrucomicrobiales bacterium]